MDAKLVCKIVTHTKADGSYRGSGYPITPNRIITAAHVVDDAAPAEGHAPNIDARQIELSFGVNEEVLQAPVVIEWSGTGVGVDVAVLRCELPAALQPGHDLWTGSSNQLIKWCARGYTEFGQAKRPGGKDAYYGQMAPFDIAEPIVALGCEDGLISTQQWAGSSGSVAFESAEAPRALAVITDYQSGKKLDHLMAVTLGFLLDSDKTRDRFRQAIQFDLYQQYLRHLGGVD